jgi:hypothetical protein
VFLDPPVYGEGFQALEMKTGSRRKGVNHLNPQTQELMLR